MEVSPGFLLLAAWLNYMEGGRLLWITAASCLLHELGHLAVLSLLKNTVKLFSLTIIGAEIRVAHSMSYAGELGAALAGPAVNLILAGLLSGVTGGEQAAGINLILGLFNLLPIGRLDGGRALRCVLCLIYGGEKGETLSKFCSVLCAVLSGAAGIWLAAVGGNITLAIISGWFFVLLGDDGIKGRGKMRIGLANLKRKR